MDGTTIRRASDLARSILGSRDSTLSALAFFPRQRASMIVGPDTQVCVEGFPRSANTFTCAALSNANPGLRLAHHVHQPAQITRAVRLGLPSAVLIREPSQAIASLYAFNAGRSGLGRLVADYIRFYEAVLGPASQGRVGVCRFEDVTASTTFVSEMLNERFGTELAHCSLSVDQLRTSLEHFDGGFDHDPEAASQFDSLVPRDELVDRVQTHRAFSDACEVYREVLAASDRSGGPAFDEDTPEEKATATEFSFADRGSIRPFVVMGPTPPPIDGVSLSTQRVTEILDAGGALAATVDTTNHQSLELIGSSTRFGAKGLFEGVRQGFSLVRALARNPDAGLYKPLSPNRAGLLRDSLMILTARLYGRKIVLHLHSSAGTRKSLATMRGPLRALVFVALRQADQVWILTPSMRQGLTPPFETGQLRVLPNFGDEMKTEVAVAAADQSRAFRLLYLGNLIPSKGYSELLAALRNLPDLSCGLEVRLVGAAPDRGVEEDLRRLIAVVPDSIEVEVRGPAALADRAAAFAWADAFVFPTSYPLEGQPLVILEALSAGLPVISTTHAGIPETVREGIEAMLVTPGDVQALASAIRTLAESSELVEQMSRAARDRYESEFAPQHYAERVGIFLGSV